MRFTNTFSGRPAYYDRNPTDILQSYAASGVAPHAPTVRWTYTVPTARKAYFEAGLSFVHVLTVATTNGGRRGYIKITSGANSATIHQNHVNFNTLDQAQDINTSSGGLLQAGDVLTGNTADTSTAGTVDYQVDAKATEFDA